jgi:ubiquinone biosynthesis protein
MRTLILYWFKIQAAKAAKNALAPHFNSNEVHDILQGYWKRYLLLKLEVQAMPTFGGSLMIHLSAMSTGFYQELTARGKSEEITTQLFYDIAWEVYQKMGRFSWWLAGWGNQGGYARLLKATRLFRAFPFNSPSYQWKDVQAGNNVVGFDCLKCPVAEYFQTKGLSEFCTKTWCALDYPLAEMWDSKLERSGSIAGGTKVCDFRWKVKQKEAHV